MARRLSPQEDMVPHGLRGEEDGGSGMIPKFLVLVGSREGCFSLRLGSERKELVQGENGAYSFGSGHFKLSVGHPRRAGQWASELIGLEHTGKKNGQKM